MCKMTHKRRRERETKNKIQDKKGRKSVTYSSYFTLYDAPCVWLTAPKLDCITKCFDMLFLEIGLFVWLIQVAAI